MEENSSPELSEEERELFRQLGDSETEYLAGLSREMARQRGMTLVEYLRLQLSIKRERETERRPFDVIDDSINHEPI